VLLDPIDQASLARQQLGPIALGHFDVAHQHLDTLASVRRGRAQRRVQPVVDLCQPAERESPRPRQLGMSLEILLEQRALDLELATVVQRQSTAK
jgi:hypothetical protein